MNKRWTLAAAVLLLVSVAGAAAAKGVVVGVNVRGWGGVSEDRQDAFTTQLAQNGVTVIREGFPKEPDDRFNHFIISAWRRGIGAVAIIYPTRGGTQKHQAPTNPAVGRPWPVPAMIDDDPAEFRRIVTAQLSALEAAGVRLTAFELGNEFNTSGYNGDLVEPGSGRVLGLSDLNNPKDAEAHAVAEGYLGYLRTLAVLKDIRDHSKLNRSTPIISGGLANVGLPGPQSFNKLLTVSIPDTLEFLRQHGLDSLVDGYGVHSYNSGDPRQTIATRIAKLEPVFRACTKAKPCWLTEWAFSNPAQICPIHDEVRVQLVQAERAALKAYIDQGRLAASLYYSWNGNTPSDVENDGAIFRCDALTDAGRLALSPMGPE